MTHKNYLKIIEVTHNDSIKGKNFFALKTRKLFLHHVLFVNSFRKINFVGSEQKTSKLQKEVFERQKYVNK